MYTLNAPFMLLIIPILLLGIYFCYTKYLSVQEVAVFSDIVQIYHRSSSYFYMISTGVILSVICLGIIGAHPVGYHDDGLNEQHVLDIGVVLDSSYSMLAEDIYPNRLEASTQLISSFIDEVQGARVGLYVYAGFPFELSPYSFDVNTLKYDIQNLEIDTIDQTQSWLQGTASADALLLASKHADSSIPSVIILMSDGEINRGQTPLPVVQYLKDLEVPVYTIGVGGSQRTDIRIYDDSGGKQVISVEGLQSDTLEAIAYHTGGKYFSFNKNTIENMLIEIYQLERDKAYAQGYVSYRIYFIYLLGIFSVATLLLWYKKFYPNIYFL